MTASDRIWTWVALVFVEGGMIVVHAPGIVVLAIGIAVILTWRMRLPG